MDHHEATNDGTGPFTAGISAPGELAATDRGADRVAGERPHGPRLGRADVERLLAADAPRPVDLRGADLRQADLSNLDLSGAHLEEAHLDGARLEHCLLRGAYLQRAQLPGAHLAQADLTRAQMDESNLETADLRGAILTDARLPRAQMSGAQLDGAALQGAQLNNAHLAHVSLAGARLRGAHLEEATLWGVRLDAAELDGAHFSGADLSDAALDGAFLASCGLADADLAQLRWDGLRVGEDRAAQRASLRERPEAYRAAADAYRRLRQACAAQGLYDRAGEMYRHEMRMRQRAHGYDALLALARAPVVHPPLRGALILGLTLAVPIMVLLRILARPLRLLAGIGTILLRIGGALRASWRQLWKPAVSFVWYLVLEVLCGYGERIGRVVIAGVLVMVTMALVYLRLGQLTEPTGGAVTSYWHALYFSTCSFSSIGYAAFSPNASGLTKWLGVAESFTGNFLLALFLVTFTRKLTR
jgi:uncharacterized protein YjbI with pentapeptide repeats